MALFDWKLLVYAAALALFAIGVLGGVGLGHLNSTRGRQTALGAALAGSLLLGISAIAYWLQPMQGSLSTGTLVPPLAGGFPRISLDLAIDRLSAFFLGVTATLAALVALYSFVWLDAEKPNRHRIAGVLNLFLLGAAVVPAAANIYLLLLGLETITLAFSILSLYRHDRLMAEEPLANAPDGQRGAYWQDQADAARAFRTYLIFSHIGVMLITAALLLLAVAAAGFTFADLRRLDLRGDPSLANLAFLLLLGGCAVKGGFFPAQSWVALVHPYSPTTTHALTLGFVIKVSSFYVLLRVVYQFLHPIAPWWGALVLVVAALTALSGVVFALAGRDLKTTLANHSVENYGIMLAGLGVALLFASEGQGSAGAGRVAALGLVASLYHMLNHAAFKALLYLCTGVIEHRAHTVEMERLGGLVRSLPLTSAAFMVGAVALAGFPPFNGFASEWLTLQAILAAMTGQLGPGRSPLWSGVLLLLLIALAAAFGLTALAFAKIIGETLLGAARDPEVAARVQRQGEAPWPMRLPLVVLSCLCLLFGVFPGVVTGQLALISRDLLGGPWSWDMSGATVMAVAAGVGAQAYTARIDIAPLALMATFSFALGLLLSRRHRAAVATPVWNCGAPYEPQTMQITGGAFGALALGWITRRRPAGQAPVGEAVSMQAEAGHDEPIAWQLLVSAGYYVVEFYRRALNAATRAALGISQRFGGWFQGGDIRQYLIYLFVVFMIALLSSLLPRR